MRPAVALAALIALSCGEGEIDPLAIDATGEIVGVVFIDVNATGHPEATDLPAPGIRVALVLSNANDTVETTTTNASGIFLFTDVPVGTYEIVPTASSLGDSLRVVFRDPPGLPVDEIDDETTTIEVAALDSVEVAIGLAYPHMSVAQARALPSGRTVTIRGVALTEVGQVGDSSLFVQDGDAAIRITRTAIASPVSVGDLVLVRGTTGRRNGQPVLNNGLVSVLVIGESLDTTLTSAAQARTAAGAALDADLVRLRQLVVTDTATTGGFFVATAIDPSGTVDVALRLGGDFGSVVIVPGSVFDVTGVLVPNPGIAGIWQVRPRSADDIRLH